MQASVSRLNQLLAQDARKLVCQKVHTMLLVFRRKKIYIALHRVRDLLRMHGRNNEMSGFRSLERRQRSLVIPDLTNKNDIRRLPKRTPQPDRKRAGVTSHLSLGEMTALAGELILDGILDRHYMSHQVLVHPLKERRDGGGFPGAGWSRYKNQAVLASAPPIEEPLGCSERFQCRHVGLDAAQDRSEAAHGAVQAHAVARMRARDEAGVAIHVAIALRVRAASLPERGHLRKRDRLLAEHNNLFINLKPRYLVLLKEDVARLLLLRGVENAFDVLLHGWRNFYYARIGRKWNRGCGRVIAHSCDMNQLEHARQLAKLMCRRLSNKKKAAHRSKYGQ